MACSNSEEGLQRLMDRLNEVAKSYKMKINVKKTKTMIVSQTEGKTVDISIEGQKVEQVKNFKYLGAVISEGGRCIDDVKQRTSHGQGSIQQKKRINDLEEWIGEVIKKKTCESSDMACGTIWVRNMDIEEDGD